MSTPSVQDLVKEAMFNALSQEKRDELVKAALTALITPAYNALSSGNKAPLQMMFEQAVVEVARGIVREMLLGDTNEAALIRSQMKDLVTAAWEKSPTKPVAVSKPAGAPAAVPAGPKRASPIQIRDLNLALNELQLGVADANALDLRGRDRESALMAARLHWISQMAGREITGIMEIGADEAASLISAAKAGEMPDTGGTV